MAFEKRGAKRYFYTARRVGKKVVKTYWSSLTADGQIKLIEQQKQARLSDREKRRDIDDTIDQISEMIGLALSVHARLNGLHNHRGDWRQFRERVQPSAGSAAPAVDSASAVDGRAVKAARPAL